MCGGGFKPEQISNHLNNDTELFLKLTGSEHIYLLFRSGTFFLNQSINKKDPVLLSGFCFLINF